MHRTSFGHLLARLMMITIFLNACSPHTAGPLIAMDTQQKETLIFLNFPLEAPQYWEERIVAFEAANPTIHIELQQDQISEDWPSRADVVLGNWPDPWPGGVNEGRALDLTPLIDSDIAFDAADFYPGALDLYRQDGHTWAIPIGWSFRAIAYLPTLFQEKGVPLPTPAWTWSDVLDAAQRLASASADRPCHSFADSTDLFIAAPNWLAERAGSPYLQQGAQIIPALDAPKMRQAMEDYIAVAQHLTVLFDDASVRTPTEILAAIAQGEAGLGIIDVSTAMDLQQRFPNIALAPLPPGEVAAHKAEWAESALFISAGTSHPKESWRWLSFLSQQNLAAYQWGSLSTRRSIAEASGAWSKMRPTQAAVIRATIANHTEGRRLAGSAGALMAYNALWQALGEVQYDHVDAAAALNHAQSVAVTTLQTVQPRNATPLPVPNTHAPLPPNTQQLEFLVMSDPGVYRQAADRFAAEYPTWQVQVSFIGARRPTGCLEFATDGSALEVAQLAEILATVDPLLEAERDLTAEAFFPSALAAVSWQERRYGIPVAVKPLVLRFRPEIFHDLGVAPPARAWTIEEVIQTASEITESGRDYFGFLPQPREMRFLLEQLGMPLFTSDVPPHPRFTAPDMQQVLARLIRLGGAQVAIPTDEAVTLISGGRVAMWFEGLNNLPQEVHANASIAAIRLQSATVLPMETTVLAIAKEARQAQGCWSWFTYLVQQEIHAPDRLSSLQQLAASEAAQPGSQQTFYVTALETLQHTKVTQAARNPTTDWAAWWFTQAMQEAAKGADLMTALQAAQDKAEAFLACLGPTGENDLDRVAECAQQVDPAHPLAQLRREQ